MSTQPKSLQEASTPKEPSVADDLRNLNNQMRAKIVSDALKKGAIGAMSGAAFSLLIFRRKLAPVWLGLGFGLGMAYSDGSQLIRNAHDSILESALSRYDAEQEKHSILTRVQVPEAAKNTYINCPMASEQAALLLKKQLKDLAKNPVDGFSAGLVDENNIYEWDIMIIGPPDTLYESGFFKARMTFPKSYPQMPPKLQFISEMWHPNVYLDGTVCISILHEPGEDQFGYEKPEERWLPVHTVETIMLSVISMLSSPNSDSPANLEAAKEHREMPELFKKKIQRIVRLSQENM